MKRLILYLIVAVAAFAAWKFWLADLGKGAGHYKVPDDVLESLVTANDRVDLGRLSATTLPPAALSAMQPSERKAIARQLRARLKGYVVDARVRLQRLRPVGVDYCWRALCMGNDRIVLNWVVRRTNAASRSRGQTCRVCGYVSDVNVLQTGEIAIWLEQPITSTL